MASLNDILKPRKTDGASLDELMQKLSEDPHGEKTGRVYIRKESVNIGELMEKLTERRKADAQREADRLDGEGADK